MRSDIELQRAQRDQLIARYLRQGLTHRAIAEHLNVSGPAISQRIAKVPELRRLSRGRPKPTEREQLVSLRHELRQVQAELRRCQAEATRLIRALTEELSALDVDDVLGLR